jgi:threonylcarbamoyladenosine tRNA methylthiotransferase MtaB
VGTMRRVLMETEAQGRTEHFTQVSLAGAGTPGAFVDVKIAGHDGRQLLAA